MNSLNIAGTGLNVATKINNTSANNIANSNTPGFKSSDEIASSLNLGVTSKKIQNVSLLDNSFFQSLSGLEYAKKSDSNIEGLSTNPFQSLTSEFKKVNITSDEMSAILSNAIDEVQISIDSNMTLHESNNKEIDFSFKKLSGFYQQYQDAQKLNKVDLGYQIANEMSKYVEIQYQQRPTGDNVPDLLFENSGFESLDKTKISTGLIGGLNNANKNIQKTIENTGLALNDFKTQLDDVNINGLNGTKFTETQKLVLDLNQPNDKGNLNNIHDVVNQLSTKLNDIVYNNGVYKNTTQANIQFRENVYNEINVLKQSQENINIDDEMIKQMKAAEMYQAMSKVIQTDQKMFESLINVVR